MTPTPDEEAGVAGSEYDVVVIGAGPAGENAADYARQHGLRVAIVERELVGGECSYWACIPSKALLRPGEALAAVRRVPAAAAAVTGPLDTAAALRGRDAFVADWHDDGQVSWLQGAGIDLVRGHGRLVDERVVEVAAEDGRTARFSAARGVVVAVGSRAVLPPIAGLHDVGAWTNREATEAGAAPRRLLVLGAGPVGVELAQAWRRLGSEEVTIVSRGSRVLGGEEPAASELLARGLRADGIGLELGRQLTAVHRDDHDGPVHARLSDGRELVADQLLVAVGRHAATGDLGLDDIGVTPGERGFLDVDEHLRVPGHPWLYVVGDANGRALQTHQGKYQGRLVGDALAGVEVPPAWADRQAVTRVVFTDPQVASVGLTAARARETGLRVRELQVGLDSVAGGSLQGEDVAGLAHLVVDLDRDVVVGATFVGPGAAELLHSATIAVAGEVPLARLWHAVPPFPSTSEVWLRLLEADRTERHAS
ncbi:NAD(P)/FAD-dependent oxidoreductase [Egicoccus sp. AB-alg2]|uniref:dihydrolipoyl dehydrogenase family protein n=1 Tax=Egicoccus sp. AB-alg2 TaxID=3242693 RepID=UPI00359ECCDB